MDLRNESSCPPPHLQLRNQGSEKEGIPHSITVLEFLSSPEPLIHYRKAKSCKEEKGKGARGRKLSQHTVIPHPEGACVPIVTFFPPSHLNAFELQDRPSHASCPFCSLLLHLLPPAQEVVVEVVEAEHKRK